MHLLRTESPSLLVPRCGTTSSGVRWTGCVRLLCWRSGVGSVVSVRVSRPRASTTSVLSRMRHRARWPNRGSGPPGAGSSAVTTPTSYQQVRNSMSCARSRCSSTSRTMHRLCTTGVGSSARVATCCCPYPLGKTCSAAPTCWQVTTAGTRPTSCAPGCSTRSLSSRASRCTGGLWGMRLRPCVIVWLPGGSVRQARQTRATRELQAAGGSCNPMPLPGSVSGLAWLHSHGCNGRLRGGGPAWSSLPSVPPREAATSLRSASSAVGLS